ncbi:hypothetical protein GCM10023347_43990 [Streptomyces chumphonensis]
MSGTVHGGALPFTSRCPGMRNQQMVRFMTSRAAPAVRWGWGVGWGVAAEGWRGQRRERRYGCTGCVRPYAVPGPQGAGACRRVRRPRPARPLPPGVPLHDTGWPSAVAANPPQRKNVRPTGARNLRAHGGRDYPGTGTYGYAINPGFTEVLV